MHDVTHEAPDSANSDQFATAAEITICALRHRSEFQLNVFKLSRRCTRTVNTR